MPAPVLSRTTSSSGSSQPSARSRRIAATPAAPSGQTNAPSRRGGPPPPAGSPRAGTPAPRGEQRVVGHRDRAPAGLGDRVEDQRRPKRVRDVDAERDRLGLRER